MKPAQTLGQLLRIDSSDRAEAIVAVPTKATLSLETPTILISNFDANDEPVIPSGFTELLPLWRITDIKCGLRTILRSQLGRDPSEVEIADRFIVYLRNGA